MKQWAINIINGKVEVTLYIEDRFLRPLTIENLRTVENRDEVTEITFTDDPVLLVIPSTEVPAQVLEALSA